jgi:hypothetical protein
MRGWGGRNDPNIVCKYELKNKNKFKKIKKQKQKTGGMAQGAECLLSKDKVLRSNPSAAKAKKGIYKGIFIKLSVDSLQEFCKPGKKD